MELRKKLDENTVIAAGYLMEGGLSLRIKRTGDKWNNAVVHLEMRNGVPVLSLDRETIEHYGIKVVEEKMHRRAEW